MFAPHKKIGSWLLVQQLDMFKDGALCGGKVDKIGHFASWKIWVDDRRLIVGVHLGGEVKCKIDGGGRAFIHDITCVVKILPRRQAAR